MKLYVDMSKEVKNVKKEISELKKKIFEDILKTKFNYGKSVLIDFSKFYRMADKTVFFLARKTLAGKTKMLTEIVRPKVSILVKESIKLYTNDNNEPYKGLKELPNPEK